MANWEEIRDKVGKAANKAAKKTEELAQSTAKHVKLKSLEHKLSSKYEDLGRLTYKQIKDEVSQAEKISRIIEDIDFFRVQIKNLKAEIEEDKKRRAEEKAAEKEKQKEEAKAEEAQDK